MMSHVTFLNPESTKFSVDAFNMAVMKILLLESVQSTFTSDVVIGGFEDLVVLLDDMMVQYYEDTACSRIECCKKLDFNCSVFMTLQCFGNPNRTLQITDNAEIGQNAEFPDEMQSFQIYRTSSQSFAAKRISIGSISLSHSVPYREDIRFILCATLRIERVEIGLYLSAVIDVVILEVASLARQW